MRTVRLNLGQRDHASVRSQRRHHLTVQRALEVRTLEDDVNQTTVRCFCTRKGRTTGVANAGLVVVGKLGCKVPLITGPPEVVFRTDDLHVGSRDDPHRLRNSRSLQERGPGVFELQREVAQLIGGGDVERNFEESVAVGKVDTRTAVERPGVIHRGISNRLKRVVNELGLDGRVGVAVEARQRRREEVGGTDDGDVDVSARWSQRGRVAGEVVGRVGEVNTHAVGACTVLAEPRPVVVVGGVAVLHDGALRVGRLTGTEELSVLVNVNLQGNGVLIPRVIGSVGDLADDLQGFTCVHLRDDFTANRAVGVGAVNRAAGWQVAVAAVHQRDVPVGAVATEERSQCSRLAGEALRGSVPRLGVRLERSHVVVVHASCIKRRLVEQRRPVAERTVTVVHG